MTFFTSSDNNAQARPGRAQSLRTAIAGLVAVLLLVALAACSSGPAGPGGGGSRAESGIIVRGTILDDQGVEIFGSIITIFVYEYDPDEGVCSPELVTDPFEATVNEGGEFYILLEFDESEFQACLDMNVAPPLGSPFQPKRLVLLDQNVNEFGVEPIHQLNLTFVLDR